MKRKCIMFGQGRIGNSMFLIAAGLHYALKYDMDFIFWPADDYREYYSNLRYGIFNKIQVERDIASNNYNGLQQKYNEYDIMVYNEPRVVKSKYGINKSIIYNEILPPPYNNSMFIVGYFLSEKYFTRKLALELFSPKDDMKLFIRDMYPEIPFEECVSVSVRRGDYLSEMCQEAGFVVNDMSFYKALFSMFPKDLRYVVTSDDIDWCKENFIGDNFYYLDKSYGNNKIFTKKFVDLYAPSFCKHNIISNSTFSWWSAYLNLNPNRKVFYQYPWFYLHEEKTDIIPEDKSWKKVIYV